MSKIDEIIQLGTEDNHTDLGNGFELITRHAINGNEFFVEFELYKNGERIFNPIDLDENEFPDEQYHAMEHMINTQKIGQMMSIEEGNLTITAKKIWYAIGDTYSVKEKLSSAKMTWEPTLKLWGKLTKPDVSEVEFVQVKTYKTENGWTYY
ncbi:MAG: hypothetical protein PHQ11_13995 [Paludibacter sp.]|nr:hypothetical protein [Paludibacter sp.]